MKAIKTILAIFAIGVVVNVQGQDQKPQRVRKTCALADADKNADGKVSMAEFEAAKTKMNAQRLERRKERFAELDANKDGVITFKEFNTKPKRAKKENFNFERIDADKDGFLSKEELKVFRAKHKKGQRKCSMGGKCNGN